jgi:serine/threonine-protein phosphatase PGAM5
MTHFLYLIRHGEASPHDGPLSETGRRQARLAGERLKSVPLSAIQHGPLERAVQTANIISENFPDVPCWMSDLAGDYIPSDPDTTGLPAGFAAFVDGYDAAERAAGPRLAAIAADRFARPSRAAAAGPAAAGPDVAPDTHELVVTHNLLIGWLVSLAMSAPDWRWLGVNQMNCALSVIAYQLATPPALITFNDAGHLPPELRWTGYPATLRPPSG